MTLPQCSAVAKLMFLLRHGGFIMIKTKVRAMRPLFASHCPFERRRLEAYPIIIDEAQDIRMTIEEGEGRVNMQLRS
jgi:hypothetical protein